ncbi:MAG: 2Fe-2S iron-sulfur cluster-binding protein, partial [Actinomycetota bacterium]
MTVNESDLQDAVATVAAVDFTLNGVAVSVRGDHPHLLAALREELDVTSPKDGCSPSGQCGCCTVLVDGKATVSCQQPLSKIAGALVTTLEGFPDHERKRYADAFAACGGLQCGFCIPGIIVRAKYQLDKKGAALKREDMARHLGAHLCRCTGYVKILDAIEMIGRGEQPNLTPTGGIGSRSMKYEAAELALGDRGYVDDIRITGMLHAALHFTAHARADIISIDTSIATRATGVLAVYTADDVPGELIVGIIHKDWPVMIPVGGRTSYAGDVLAIIVADTRQHARDAAQLISVDYAPLAPITDPALAIAHDDPANIAVWQTTTNVLSTSS